MSVSPAGPTSDLQETPVEVRDRLADTLRLDLVGPWAGHQLERERLPWRGGRVRPSTWYLTGFIVPRNQDELQRSKDNVDVGDDLDETPSSQGATEDSSDDGKPARRGYFPTSLGLSFLVSRKTCRLRVTVRWGDYDVREIGKSKVWCRTPHEASWAPEVPESGGPGEWHVPDSNGLVVQVVVRPVRSTFISTNDSGVRAVSIFLVNRRAAGFESPLDDHLYAFQPEIEVKSDHPFPARPIVQGTSTEHWDDSVAALHYSDTPEYATGHGVSADWTVVDGQCRLVRTAWIGQAHVEVTSTSEIPGPQLSMDHLGCVETAEEVHSALDPLVERYRDWITSQGGGLDTLPGDHRETAEELLRLAGIAATRIESGIELVATDPDVRDAFRVANRAVGRALKQRLGVEAPEWRPFQLAFILLNLSGIADPNDPHRMTVDLLFFPTGGGKTEAYLGLAAFTMVLRRLRNPSNDGRAGGGVSVLMRYTLRLLTLDQLARASGLVCALELERRQRKDRYGAWPFEIGLWVGSAATPNRMGSKGKSRGSAREKVNQFKSDPAGKPSPIPLEECPWCRGKFQPESFNLHPDSDRPTNLVIHCTDLDCEFSEQPLPIIAVDEPLYRRLPAFVIATIDKFAALPWTGESGALLGGADRFDGDGYYGAATPRRGRPLDSRLQPPDLIVQDELHLISGPLGTMAGLYETVIEALCASASGQTGTKPKIVASTATIRQAKDQVQALFARSQTQVFPPSGPDRRDSFFARTVRQEEKPARRYLGVSAQGRSAKVVTRRVHAALMGAAMRAYLTAGGDRDVLNPADPYMTVITYFNALRELGGARRILEEEVQNTIKTIGARKRHGEKKGLFRDRLKFSGIVELTSRVSTSEVAAARRALDTEFRLKPKKGTRVVDCALATNMISVGLDIPRLGLMVVVGQPKTASEYIQATSRVGRESNRPGLVVTLLNMYKPRDRSHYERFKHFHETFYRAVEVASVTPFAARALDRGLAGALVALARHAEGEMTGPKGAGRIKDFRSSLHRLATDVFRARIMDQPTLSNDEDRSAQLEAVCNRIDRLLDDWAKRSPVDGALRYQKYEAGDKSAPVLLHGTIEGAAQALPERAAQALPSESFRANRSLRDVEPVVDLALLES